MEGGQWGVLIGEVLEKGGGEATLARYLGEAVEEKELEAAAGAEAVETPELDEAGPEPVDVMHIIRYDRFGRVIPPPKPKDKWSLGMGTRTMLVRKLLAKAEAHSAPQELALAVKRADLLAKRMEDERLQRLAEEERAQRADEERQRRDRARDRERDRSRDRDRDRSRR